MGQRPDDLKLLLHDALRAAREHTLSRLEGLSEYDLRRPMTPTGTNLLGVVKHLSGIEYGYLGEVFGRTIADPIPGDDDLGNNGDMWARPDESRDWLIGWYRRACAHADETIHLLDLDATGSVPWWNEGHRTTTLGATMIRVLAEENSHGGHLAIVRELIDGRADDKDTTFATPEEWKSYVAKVQAAADHFA